MGGYGKHGPLVSAPGLILHARWPGLSLSLMRSAGAAQCSLALLLALDVSSSVDSAEYRLQRDGVAQALQSPDVLTAILSQSAPVALAAYEWSGQRQSVDILDWTLLGTEADVLRAADEIAATRRSHTRFPTATGMALGYGANRLREAPACDRQVIDVSGDGVTNDGFWPNLAYKHFPFDGVTVNGLAVLGADPDVLRHYEQEIRFGPDAFVETAPGYEGFRDAMTRKLLREIGTRIVGEAR